MAEVDLGMDELMKRVMSATDALKSGKVYERALHFVGERAVTRAKKLTPVDTGNLRRGWAVRYDAAHAKAYVYNSVKYAPYVNYGHRLRRRKRGNLYRMETIGFVEGQHMFETTFERIKKYDLGKARKIIFEDLKKEMDWE